GHVRIGRRRDADARHRSHPEGAAAADLAARVRLRVEPARAEGTAAAGRADGSCRQPHGRTPGGGPDTGTAAGAAQGRLILPGSTGRSTTENTECTEDSRRWPRVLWHSNVQGFTPEARRARKGSPAGCVSSVR